MTGKPLPHRRQYHSFLFKLLKDTGADPDIIEIESHSPTPASARRYQASSANTASSRGRGLSDKEKMAVFNSYLELQQE
jgi:hypothetical protein